MINENLLNAKRRLKKEDLMSNLSELLDRVDFNNYKESYTGIVEDNRDPDLQGKCKIRCYGLHDSIPTSDLPWAIPCNTFVGSKKGSFIVPTVGTVLEVVFDSGDIYTPKYTGKVVDNNQTFDADKTEDYPNTMIFFETDNGDYLKMNRRTGETEFYSTAGVLFSISPSGKISISSVGNPKYDDGGSMDIDLSGNFDLDVLRGDVKIKAQNVTVESFGKCDVKANGDINIKSLGDTNITTQSFKVEPMNIGTFSGSLGNESVGITVSPNPLGGPFNCLMFDPVTCAPHQGTSFEGVSLATRGTSEVGENPELLVSVDPKTLLPITKGAPLPSLVEFNPF